MKFCLGLKNRKWGGVGGGVGKSQKSDLNRVLVQETALTRLAKMHVHANQEMKKKTGKIDLASILKNLTVRLLNLDFILILPKSIFGPTLAFSN